MTARAVLWLRVHTRTQKKLAHGTQWALIKCFLKCTEGQEERVWDKRSECGLEIAVVTERKVVERHAVYSGRRPKQTICCFTLCLGHTKVLMVSQRGGDKFE